ncbi:MAG: hypothetical protein AB2L14_27385 [Candidatus Xenobiia bacterium LiM19]
MMTATREHEQTFEKLDWREYHQDFEKLAEWKRVHEDEYRAAKLLQQSGAIPADLGLYLIAHTLITLSEEFVSLSGATPATLIQRLGNDMKALDEQHRQMGLEEEDITKLPEMQKLDNAFLVEMNRIEAAIFRAYGEFDLAEMMERDREAYNQLMAVDKKYFGNEGGA